ncbi:hypothetical protein K469DRAFT_264641 [Zopfia rhizophila CBS 207.26]|uniref:Mid2 domain-containing protein n=1 Tax=Zopfia rhizophila CBS 207.26 TaxID=1314779 RepID=A0A6A6DSX3_9PEZI|nr:hypothetical protein K469DRAFT_264641 [Zopfia rhizophila CBS 207.26]
MMVLEFSFSLVISMCSAYFTTSSLLPPSTSSLKFAKRQDTNQNFIGYLNTETNDAITCDDLMIWTTSDTWGRCCYPNSPCDIATKCEGDSVVVYQSSSVQCTASGADRCVVDYIHADLEDQDPVTFAGCDSKREAWSLYKATTEVTQVSSKRKTVRITGATRTASVVTSQAIPTTTAAPSKGLSAGSVAAIVLGVLLGSAILAGLGFWYGRKSREREEEGEEGEEGDEQVSDQQVPSEFPPHYRGAGP